MYQGIVEKTCAQEFNMGRQTDFGTPIYAYTALQWGNKNTEPIVGTICNNIGLGKPSTYFLRTTSSKARPQTLPGTGSDINSTHVTYRACAAGLGNSLNLQSQLGNGDGVLLLMAECMS